KDHRVSIGSSRADRLYAECSGKGSVPRICRWLDQPRGDLRISCGLSRIPWCRREEQIYRLYRQSRQLGRALQRKDPDPGTRSKRITEQDTVPAGSLGKPQGRIRTLPAVAAVRDLMGRYRRNPFGTAGGRIAAACATGLVGRADGGEANHRGASEAGAGLL